MKVYILLTSLMILITSLSAMEEYEDRDRIKSVRDLITTSHITKKDEGIVDTFRNMFEDGKTTGQIRFVHTSNTKENSEDTLASATGGKLKYELAKLNGFNGAVALRYSEDISFASGKVSENKRDTRLSSSSSEYSTLSEAYVAYADNNFNIKIGRQIVDTPLADLDDIAMVQNTFEAATFKYNYDKLSINAGYLSRWQGIDAGLDDGWVDTGDDGTSYLSLGYSGLVDAQLWYYNIDGLTDANNALYAELSYRHMFNDHTSFFGALQYMDQSELSNSSIEANIYGAIAEIISHDIGFNIAYNRSIKNEGHDSFAGFGGGSLFTNMDTMILNEITYDRNAESVVAGISYEIDNFAFLYAYGDFKGDADSVGNKAHIVEQDMGVEYDFNEEFIAYVIYVKSEDKQALNSTDSDFEHIRIMANYNF